MGSKGARKITGDGEEKMKYYKFIFLVFGLWSLVFGLTGCGYTTRSAIVSKYKTIYVKPFVNKIDITVETDAASKYKIYKPFLETDITKKVINKYLFDGNLKPAKEENADLVLKGELVDFRKDPLRYTDSDEVEEYRLNLVVNISLWNNRKKELIWEENNFTGDFSYFTTLATSPNVTKKTDEQAIPDAISDLARRIVERTVEQW